jgi:hypothetical protein
LVDSVCRELPSRGESAAACRFVRRDEAPVGGGVLSQTSRHRSFVVSVCHGRPSRVQVFRRWRAGCAGRLIPTSLLCRRGCGHRWCERWRQRLGRNDHRLSRNPVIVSGGWYRPGVTSAGAVPARAFSLRARSACTGGVGYRNCPNACPRVVSAG